MADRPGTFVCPACGQVNRHPDDVANRYCGRCHWWTGDPHLAGQQPSAPADSDQPTRLTRRQYLTRRVVLNGMPWPLALEAVASTALARPEIDWDERRTWDEWERDFRDQRQRLIHRYLEGDA